MDNQEFAILTKMNDLAERYGIKPYDFLATITHDSVKHTSMLAIEIPFSRTNGKGIQILYRCAILSASGSQLGN